MSNSKTKAVRWIHCQAIHHMMTDCNLRCATVFFVLISRAFLCLRFNETGLYYAIVKHSFSISKKQIWEREMIAASVGARIKCALVLIIFMLIPILPVTGTIGLFIVIFRPMWFKKLVDNVYADKNDRLIL
jgi:hypothetical protein